MTEELVISQEWVLFKTALNAFAFLGLLNKNRWPTLHTLLMFYLCALLFLGILLNMHLRKNSRIPWHNFDE